MKIFILFKRPHWLYLISFVGLLIWGSIAIFSATQSLYHETNFFQQHILYMILGIVLFFSILCLASTCIICSESITSKRDTFAVDFYWTIIRSTFGANENWTYSGPCQSIF
jgi:uncharacterized membrane protein